MCKKFLSLFLAFALLIGQTPAVFAANDEVLDDPTVIVQEVTEDTTVIEQEASEDTSAVQQEDSEEPSGDEQEVSDESSDVNGEETTETESEADVSDEGADEPALTKTSYTVAPDPGLPGNDELFAAYAESVLYGNSIATFGTAARAELIGDEVVLYDALVPFIKEIAAGNRDSAVIAIGQEASIDGVDYPVDVEATFESEDFTEETEARVINALLADYPYEMYWYNKVMGCDVSVITSENPSELIQVAFYFFVAPNYCGGTMVSVDTAKTGVASKAAAVAQEIVAKYANSADLDKLYCYKQEICDLVSYNDEAAESGDFSVNNDPWQLIYVFDGDATTNVVCEGYSKAFMYLCDLSDFTGDVACYTVTGNMSDGTKTEAHMWNIVTMDGCNYLADVTNSDSGSIGQDGSLFLVTGEGSAADGYDVNGTSYVYDAETIDMWGLNPESILNLGANDTDSGEVTADHIEFRYWSWDSSVGGYVEEATPYTAFATEYPYSMVGKLYAINSDGTGNPLPADSFLSSNLDVAVINSIADAGESNLVIIEATGVGTTEISLASSSDFAPVTVTVDMPRVAYYTQPVANVEYFINMDSSAFEVTESNRTVYLVLDGQRTFTNVELQGDLANYASVEILSAGNAAAITFNNDLPVTDQWGARYQVYQQYDSTEPDESGGGGYRQLLVINTVPHLFATWPGQNYNDNPFDGYEFYHNGTNSFDFWFGTSEEAVKVAYEDLTVTGVAAISESWYWNEYDEQVTCVDVGTTGYGKGAVIYTVGDKSYEFLITRSLPIFGFYSSSIRSEDTCLDALRAEAGEPVEFYFLWREDVSAPTGGIIVTDHNDNEIPVEFDVETGLVQMTAPEQSGYLNFAVELGHEWTYQGIDYINTAPRLFATWSGESYLDGFFESYEMNDSSNYSFEFWFGTAESAVRVPFEDLTVTGVASISEGGCYEEDGETITRVNVSTTGFGTGAVEYKVGEKTYKFLLSRVLPDYGFYSSDVRSEETYLEQLRGEADKTMEFYFLTEEGNSPVESMTAMDDYGNAIPVEFDSETGLVKMTAPKNSVQLRFKAVYGENLGWYWIDFINTAPHLFAQRAGDESSDNYIEYFMAPSEYSGQIFHFYFGYPGNAVKVDVSDLNAEGVANITENTYEDYLGQEITACFVGASDFGEGAVVYTVDGVDYKFPVTGKLPDLGAYKANVLSEENYIDTYDTLAGETVTVYLKGSGDFHEIYTITGVYGEYYDGNEWFDFDVTATPVGRDYEVTFVSPGYDVDLFAQMGDGGEYVSLYYTGETEEEVPDVITDTCGENLTWEFVVETGVLTISGTGPMYAYAPLGENSENESPFSGADVIKSVIVNEGVTYIGSNAFEGCSMTLVQLPTTLEAVGENAFKDWNGEFLCIMYPGGSVAEWLNVNLSSGNDVLFTAEMMPLEDGGKIGEELYWQVSDGTLTFLARGTGSGMYESENGEPYEMPWAGYTDQITKIDMQKGITINDGAFAGLTKVTELALPAYLLYFQDAIGDLTALEKIEIPAENDGGYEVTADGKAILRSNTEAEGTYTLYAVAPTVGEEFTIPMGVTAVHFNAFKNCANLETLNIPASTTLILPNAFSGCTALTTVNYDGSAEDWAAMEILDGNEALKNANIVFAEEEAPSGVCGDNLTWELKDGMLTISGTGAMYDYVSAADGGDNVSPFANSTEIKTVIVKDGVTSIGGYAFAGCTMTLVQLPTTLEAVYPYAFAGCDQILCVMYPEGSVVDWLNVSLSEGNHVLFTSEMMLMDGGKIGEELYWQIIDGTLTFLARGTGSGMYESENGEPYEMPWAEFADEITKIDMQKGITINDGAFAGLTNVTELTLPAYLLYFQDAIGDLTALEKIEIPAENDGGYEVTADGKAILRSNTEAEGTYTLYAVAPTAGEEFFVPEGVTCIHFNAFKNCANITTLNIPASTTLVLPNAFSGCTALTTVNYGGTDADWAAVEILDGNEALKNAKINTKHVHTEVIDEAIAVTCTRAGVTEGKHCSDCGEVLVAQEVIPATGHYYDAGTVIAEPTCTTDGQAVSKCTVCGDTINARNLDEILVRRLTNTANLIAGAPYYDYSPEYIINEIAWNYLVNYDQTWKFVVPAAEFEAEVGKYFKTDTMMIQMLREYAASLNPEYASVYYDAEFNTYTVRPVGGFGGSMDERQYVGYVKSGSEYTAYYCTINYVFLTEVMDDADSYAESLGYPETIEYEGQIFSNGPDGYYYIESIADSGRKVTMEFNDNVVRIVDVRDFTAAELPTAFDDVDGGMTGHLNDKDNDYFCDDCGADLCVSHIPVAIPAVDATCTETGLTEGSKCDNCGRILELQEVVPALGHDLQEWVGRTPSCDLDGIYPCYYCLTCEKYFDINDKTKELDDVHYGEPTGHHFVVVEGKAPTCTEAGNLPYRYCDNSYTFGTETVECHERYITIDGVEESWCAYTDDTAMIERAQLPALGHTEGNVMIENEIAATCTTAGSADYVVNCAECGEELSRETIEVPMTAHNVSYVEDKEATFTAAGCNEHYKCDVCGALFLTEQDAADNKPCAKDKVILPQKVTVSAGKAEVEEAVIDEAISNSTETTVTLPLTEAAEETKAAQLPVVSLNKIKEADKELTVETNFATVTMDTKALETIVAEAGNADSIELVVEEIAAEELKPQQQTAISEKKVAAVISAEILVNGDNVHDFDGGVVTVKIPFAIPEGGSPDDYYLVYVDDMGNIEDIPSKHENGYLVAELQHFSEYVIMDNHECADANGDGKCDVCGEAMVKKLWGDADGDGYVDYWDASLILQYEASLISKDDFNMSVCDVDEDGYVDYWDASLILQYEAGILTMFPVEE